MTKIDTNVPFLPRGITVEAQPHLRDASFRTDSGLEIVIVWETEDGTERGFKMFLDSRTLEGTTAIPFKFCEHGPKHCQCIDDEPNVHDLVDGVEV